MIKSNLGEVTFKGNEIIIGADMAVIMRAYINILASTSLRRPSRSRSRIRKKSSKKSQAWR